MATFQLGYISRAILAHILSKLSPFLLENSLFKSFMKILYLMKNYWLAIALNFTSIFSISILGH